MDISNHGHTPVTDKISSGPIRHACVLARGGVWCLTHLDRVFHRERYFRTFELLLSRQCPLDCKCCIHFIPDYKDPVYESAESVITNMKKLLSALSYIDEVSISGGDAFYYPELSTVVSFLLSSDKIGKVSIVSESGVSPDKETLRLLSDPKLMIKVDDYGELSEKTDEFRALHSDSVVITTYTTWEDFGDESDRHRSPKELDAQYAACRSERYCYLNGKIYACPRSAHGENLGYFSNTEEESVDLRNIADDADLLRKIRRMKDVRHLTACNHCDCRMESFKTYDVSERLKGKSE